MSNVLTALLNIGGALYSTPWRPLFNATKFDWRPLLKCRAVTMPRCKICWNLQGCLKLVNRSQPLGSWSLEGHVEEVFLFNMFFSPIVDTCLSCKDSARQSCMMVPKWWFFCVILHPVFPASRMQHISDLHSKFALRPHHVQKYGRHPLCDHWD